MKTILVPVDFSKCSIAALDYAVNIAKKAKASIHLLNVVGIPSYYFVNDPYIVTSYNGLSLEKIYKNLRERSEKKLHRIASNLDALPVTAKVINGQNIHEEILKYSEDIYADIIIMGSHGSSGIKGIIFGSN